MKRLIIVIMLSLFITTQITAETTKNSKKVAINSKININSATMKELTSLPGIGKGTAIKIIEYRELNGKFTATKQLLKIKGIGKAKFGKIKDFIVATGDVVKVKMPKKSKKSKSKKNKIDKKININTASLKELIKLPGIGKSTAQKIINYRANKKFRDIRNILKVNGIGKAKFNKIKEFITVD